MLCCEGGYTYRIIACMKRQTTMLCAEEVVTPLARTESSHAWKLAVWKGTGGKSIHCCGWLCGVCVSKINVSQTCSCMQPALLWSHDPCLCLYSFLFSIFYIRFIYEVYHDIYLCLDLKVGTMELSPEVY